MIRSRRIGRNATFAAFLVLAAAFEYFAVPRLLMLSVPSVLELGLLTFSSCAIVIGLVGGWLRVPIAWLLAALVLAIYLGAVGAWAARPNPPENVWLLGLWWSPFVAPPAIFGVIAWVVVTKVAERRR